MKKIFTAVLLVLILPCFNNAAVHALSAGVIRELSGAVEIKFPGASSFIGAKVGDSLMQDAVISTGFRSTAIIELGSSILTVRPLTRLSLKEIKAQAGAETLNVNLQAGRVKVDVNPPLGIKTAMSISSPVATASVRGTSFEFDTRNLYVNHGSVSFIGSNGKYTIVNAGYSCRMEPDGKPVDPVKLKKSDLRPRVVVGSDRESGTGNESVNSPGGFIFIEVVYGASGKNSNH